MPIQNLTDEQYHSDPSNFGDYQYISLRDFVTDFMASIDPNSYISTIRQHRVIQQAKRGIREFNYDIANEIRVVELDLSPTLTIAAPKDLVNYVRVSMIDSEGYLRPISIDLRSPIADAYLQDHQYGFLYDNNGEILTGSSEIVQSQGNRNPYNYEFNSSFGGFAFFGGNGYFNGLSSIGGFAPNTNLSQTYPIGSMTFDKARGIFRFTDLEAESIVIEYISDGMSSDESRIRVHKFLEEALRDYVYYQLIQFNRDTPANEKERARREYHNSLRRAKRRIHSLKPEQLRQIFRGSSVWIKN